MRFRRGVLQRAGSCRVLGRMVFLAAVVWPAGPSAAQSPPNPAACELEIEGESISSLALVDGNGVLFEYFFPGKSLWLPAGQYRIENVELEGGPGYLAFSPSGFDEFVLTPGEPCRIKIGGPLVPKVTVKRRGKLLELNYELTDAGSRPYTDQQPMAPPWFTVYQDGRELGSGTFEYG